MGQQQLILLVMVAVVVGVMTVVAMSWLHDAQKESEKDAIRQDLMNGASRAGAFYAKPTALGGGGGSFMNITFQELGLDTASYNGYYFNIVPESQSFQISASTVDRTDTLTATITKSGITWNQ